MDPDLDPGDKLITDQSDPDTQHCLSQYCKILAAQLPAVRYSTGIESRYLIALQVPPNISRCTYEPLAIFVAFL
jgi:hypothetical protein